MRVQGAWLWLIDPKNAQTLTAWGFVIGVAGFAITLAGFALAYWRLSKLETASGAATTAVQNFKLRVTQYDAANDAAEARYAILSARRHLDNDAWRDVVESYEDARRAMLRIGPGALGDDPAILEEIRKMNVHIDKLCTIIDRATNDPQKAYPDKTTTLKSIRKHQDTIYRVNQVLQQRS
jgi:hypothetical protein